MTLKTGINDLTNVQILHFRFASGFRAMKPTSQAFTTITQNKTPQNFLPTKSLFQQDFIHKIFYLYGCLVYVFAYFMFCCLITNRELYNNRISSLPSDVFKDLYSIRDLFIEHNSISSIPLKTFQSTHNMEFL